MKSLSTVQTQCLKLMFSFLSATEQWDLKEMKIHEELISKIKENHSHHHIHLSMTDFQLDNNNYYQIKINVNLSRLFQQHKFIQNLQNTYCQDYNLQKVMNFDIKHIKWYDHVRYCQNPILEHQRDFVPITDFGPNIGLSQHRSLR